MKLKKFKKGKFYHIKWLDHCSCYPRWTDLEQVSDEELECDTVGIFVKETKNTLYFALTTHPREESLTVSCLFQIVKSTILKSKELK